MLRRSLLGVVLGAGLGACGGPPASAPAARQSMVIVTVDTLRADHVRADITPVLVRLAGEATTFDNAITVAPVTAPSHASLLTATYPPAHGVRDNQIFSLDPSARTLVVSLQERGYRTGAFVSAIVLNRRFGLNRGFDVYDDELGEAAERSAGETLARAQRWIGEESAAGRPFFAWIHLFEPHAPYAAGSYAAEVTTVDEALGGFFAWLRERRLWDSLVLSVTSDHGEALGEHGESTHGFFVYDSTLRIPWILKGTPQKGVRFAPQVRIVDVLPTMISLANAGGAVGGGAAAALDGVDLAPFLAKAASPNLEAYAEAWLPRHQFNWSELRAVRTERFKFIDAPEAELYDLASDPAESRNVAGARQDTVARLRATIAAIERHGARAARPAAADPVLAERFMALGYIGYSAGAGGDEPLPDPKTKLPVYELTMSAFELAGREKPAAALDALRRAEALDPAVTQVHYLKGTILGNQGRYDAAAAALERAAALNPRYVPARFKLALAYLRLGRHARAEATLEAVLEAEPANVRAIHNLAAIAYARGDLSRAEALEQKALAIDARYFDAWNTLGAVYLLSKRHAEAVRALETAIAIDPRSGQAHHNLSLALNALGRSDAAAGAATKACALDSRFCR